MQAFFDKADIEAGDGSAGPSRAPSALAAQSQGRAHMLVVKVLDAALSATRPPELRVRTQMTVTLGLRDRPEPDVLLVDASAVTGIGQTSYPCEVVRLVVEMVSPESQERDRLLKPRLYAQAGIPHFWRVEDNDGLPVVHVYELVPGTRAYTLSGIHHGRLKLAVPYGIDADLAAIDSL